MPSDIPTERQDDPVVAWKEAMLMLVNGSVELRSNYNSDVRITAEGKRAVCGHGDSHGGLIPRVDCTCGWYGLKELPVNWLGVWIEVEFYGRVIECTKGYRAEYQRVIALLVPKGWCQGGFLCDGEPTLLQFNPMNKGFICVCPEHADEMTVIPEKVEKRLAVPIRMVHVERLE